MAAIVEVESGEIARPLKVLVPLIKQDFEEAEEAGMAYYKAAGEKLTEAREGHFEGDIKHFYEWAEKNFGKKRDQIRTYMALVSTVSRKPFRTLDDFHKSRGKPVKGYADTPRLHREWTAPVDAVAERARRESMRLAQEDALTRAQEREAERKLAHRLIDIGYKVLAKELHPDKMHGDRDAMARLNRIRDKLKHSI